MKKAPSTFQAHGAGEHSATMPDSLSRNQHRSTPEIIRQSAKRLVVGLAVWGLLPVVVAEWLISVGGLRHD